MAAHAQRTFSTSAFDLFSCFAIASTKAPTPSDSVGPARMLFTVTPVPATNSAIPRATAISESWSFRSAPFPPVVHHFRRNLNPRFARYEKNPAPVPFQHPCEIVSREPHSAHHVYLKEAVPVRIGNLCKRLGLENAHIVHQYIHRWEFRNHGPCAG